MGESELKKALQREGEALARVHWQDAENAVKSRRSEIEAQIEQLRSETDRKLQADIEELRGKLLFAALTESRKCRLLAEADLAERLYSLAQQLLHELISSSREDLWQTFCAELPTANWSTLIVHPEDHTRAQQSFPEMKIDSDPKIGGGMIATSADGEVRVDNTLTCRLARAWPDLLPKLMKELQQQVEKP